MLLTFFSVLYKPFYTSFSTASLGNMMLCFAMSVGLASTSARSHESLSQAPSYHPLPSQTKPGSHTKPETGSTSSASPLTTPQLFEALAQAATPQAAAQGEARILERWRALGQAPAQLLVQRATLAVFQHRKPELAIELLDRATSYHPEWTESWVLRALIFKNMGDVERAMLDLRHVLAREPRHFMALSHMGAILIEQKQWDPALRIHRQIAALSPQREGLAALIDKLLKKGEGKAL
jgi:tetratricopeptide (TPR) repeat protein